MIFEYLFVFAISLISLVWLPMVLYDAVKQAMIQYKNELTIDMIMVDIIGILMAEVVLFILLYNHIVEIIHRY